MREELQAVRALPARIGVGKMHSDIAERDGSQHGVCDRVSENVGVGVPFQTEIGGHRNSAQY
jgi:hypothetical protein